MQQPPSLPVVAVHLDLKSAAFRPGYLPEYLETLADLRVNTLLLEYEDVFPFQCVDVIADQPTAWRADTVKSFLDEAARLKIDIIPLQQCLGHLEYVYRWERYRKHAEDRSYPSTLRLSSPAAKKQVLAMLGEICDAHPASRFVHLGMDEAHALVHAGKRMGKSVLDLFIDWLLELTDFVEARGKTPLIWSDMLEDHFEELLDRRKSLDALRDRVVFVPWDYDVQTETTPVTRIGGWRVSREWRDDPMAPEAPPLRDGVRYVEDLPPALLKIIKPFREGRMFNAVMQADVWTSLGFKLLGATSVRNCFDLSVLPNEPAKRRNIDVWGDVIRRTNQWGLIGTSWSRGNSFCPPAYPVELQWPATAHLSRVLGKRPKPIWPGIPAKQADALVLQLGRCRTDWAIEAQVADAMQSLTPTINKRRIDWDAHAVMARVYDWRRRAAFAIDEVEYFHANHRPIDAEWTRRLNDQTALLKEVKSLSRDVSLLFSQRYHGLAFVEWQLDLFDLMIEKLKHCQTVATRKRQLAKQAYA